MTSPGEGPPARHGEPEQPAGAMVRALSAAAAVGFVLAVLGAALPGRTGSSIAAAAIVLVVAVHPARVVVLGLRWAKAGDRRFALAASALLVLMGGAAAVSLLP